MVMAAGTVEWRNTTKCVGFAASYGGDKGGFVHICAVERAGLASPPTLKRIRVERRASILHFRHKRLHLRPQPFDNPCNTFCVGMNAIRLQIGL